MDIADGQKQPNEIDTRPHKAARRGPRRKKDKKDKHSLKGSNSASSSTQNNTEDNDLALPEMGLVTWLQSIKPRGATEAEDILLEEEFRNYIASVKASRAAIPDDYWSDDDENGVNEMPGMFKESLTLGEDCEMGGGIGHHQEGGAEESGGENEVD